MSECYVEKIVELALSEVGYKEKATNSQLDDKTANAGHNNYNKYAKYIDDNYPNFYNGKKNGFDWCAVFVDYLFIKAYGYENALRLTCQPEHSYGASCTMDVNYYKAKNRFGTYPRVGAQIFFTKDKTTSYHTGIVVSINGDKITTVEGNASDSVAKKVYDKSDPLILGYGYPDYSESKKQFVLDIDSSKYNQVIINIK